MERETREKKYAKLRDEIENIDTTILENMERNRKEKVFYFKRVNATFS